MIAWVDSGFPSLCSVDGVLSFSDMVIDYGGKDGDIKQDEAQRIRTSVSLLSILTLSLMDPLPLCNPAPLALPTYYMYHNSRRIGCML